jgi:hypothetical protein
MKTTDCEALRRELKPLAERVLALRGGTNGEAIANVLLAYRHLEDASMRLGKAIQALDGGVSGQRWPWRTCATVPSMNDGPAA